MAMAKATLSVFPKIPLSKPIQSVTNPIVMAEHPHRVWMNFMTVGRILSRSFGAKNVTVPLNSEIKVKMKPISPEKYFFS